MTSTRTIFFSFSLIALACTSQQLTITNPDDHAVQVMDLQSPAIEQPREYVNQEYIGTENVKLASSQKPHDYFVGMCENIDLPSYKHQKYTKQESKDFRAMAIMVANAMGTDSRLPKMIGHRESHFRPVRHKKKADVRAAINAWEVHVPDPDRIDELEMFIERFQDWKNRKKQVADARKELRQRTKFINNPYIFEKKRWSSGLGFYGQQPIYGVSFYDVNAPPEVLCDPIIGTWVLINKWRAIASMARNKGHKPTWLILARGYGTGGDFNPRPPFKKPKLDTQQVCEYNKRGKRTKSYNWIDGACWHIGMDQAFRIRARRYGISDPDNEAPRLGWRGWYEHDDPWEHHLEYVRSEKRCIYTKSGSRKENNVWRNRKCYYQHSSKHDYIELELRPFVEEKMQEKYVNRSSN